MTDEELVTEYGHARREWKEHSETCPRCSVNRTSPCWDGWQHSRAFQDLSDEVQNRIDRRNTIVTAGQTPDARGAQLQAELDKIRGEPIRPYMGED